jgi:hypothetical protein
MPGYCSECGGAAGVSQKCCAGGVCKPGYSCDSVTGFCAHVVQRVRSAVTSTEALVVWVALVSPRCHPPSPVMEQGTVQAVDSLAANAVVGWEGPALRAHHAMEVAGAANAI